MSKKLLKRGEKKLNESKDSMLGRIDKSFFGKGKKHSQKEEESQPSGKKATVMDESSIVLFLYP